MAKRRPSGDGMVRKREDGRWEGRIVVGHKDNGDSIFRYLRLYISPGLGHIPLNRLTAKDTQRFFAWLKTEGRADQSDGETGLADSQLRNIHSLCWRALEKAVSGNLIPQNPASGCKLPPARKGEMNLLSRESMQKLLICNLLEAGKSVIALDAEHELEELCENLGGCFIDLMAGEKRINVLEVRSWNEDADSATDETVPEAFRKSTLLARHISFLKDFFRAYKDFSDPQLDTIEIMLSKLYARWGITEETELRQLASEDYPILSDLYDLMQEELAQYKPGALYTQELLQEVLLGLHSLCVGADAPFFNGHTNISGDRFLVFGVGGVLTAAKSLRNALLFNVLAYMSDRLLTGGNTVAVLDELYLWLSNPVAIEYIRNCLKRVRKRDSALVMASQNLEDFDQEGVREMTKPLFAIPPHQFLFNPGSIGKRFYMDMLQLDEAEFELIQRARRGECLYKCGMERYHLEVKAPTHKAALFGSAGGR